MFIPLWILVLLMLCVGVYFLIGFNFRVKSDSDGLDEIWQSADQFRNMIMKKDPPIEGGSRSRLIDASRKDHDRSLDDIRFGVHSARLDFLRLRERYKDDARKLRRVIEDWRDFAAEMYQLKSDIEIGREISWPDDRSDDRHAILKEIAKRLKDELGDESSLDRLYNSKKISNRKKGSRSRVSKRNLA